MIHDLVSIVAGAADGDTIILPGGVHNLTGSLVIEKRIVLVGAGALGTSTSVTGVTSLVGTNVGGFQEKVLITSTGAGSMFTGISFNAPVQFTGFGNNSSTFSASFERCLLNSSFALGGFASPVVHLPSNVSVKQCIFLYGINTAKFGTHWL